MGKEPKQDCGEVDQKIPGERKQSFRTESLPLFLRGIGPGKHHIPRFSGFILVQESLEAVLLRLVEKRHSPTPAVVLKSGQSHLHESLPGGTRLSPTGQFVFPVTFRLPAGGNRGRKLSQFRSLQNDDGQVLTGNWTGVCLDAAGGFCQRHVLSRGEFSKRIRGEQ